jgi:hypothetical protein
MAGTAARPTDGHSELRKILSLTRRARTRVGGASPDSEWQEPGFFAGHVLSEVGGL